ncbi:hypothetical protein [Natronomonas sp.]|uniref:DUF7857 domain-containing protein n=1 Tax=Natronomonas sp. TaxID=2184060 RepID=UPI003988E71F
MPELDIETIRSGGVTFVEVCLHADQAHRVRIEPRVDGAVWLPRTDGRLADGWDERSVTATVEPGTTPFGFATPKAPKPPVVELVAAEPMAAGALPDGVESWLRRVEARVGRAERIAAVDDLASATDAVTAEGGLAEVESLAAALARDRRLCSRLSFVPDDLERRLLAVDIPVETLQRLAHSRRS